MFTINVYLRFALIAGGFLVGGILWGMYGFWYGFPFLLVALVLLIGYLLLGTILSTNMLLSSQQIAAAEERLKLTYFPKLLFGPYRGVYFMTHGAIAMQKKDFVEGEKWLRTALETGLPSDNEKGAAMLQLLMINAQKGNKPAIQHQVAEIKKLNITEPMLREQIKEVEKQLKLAQQNPMSPSTMAMMGGRGGFRPGSKRPRPKMK